MEEQRNIGFPQGQIGNSAAHGIVLPYAALFCISRTFIPETYGAKRTLSFVKNIPSLQVRIQKKLVFIILFNP